MKELLHLLAVLMCFDRQSDGVTINMDCVAQTLADWPNGFYRFLQGLQRSSATAGSKAFKRQYNDVYYRLFGAKLARGREWMRASFIDFGLDHAQDAIVNTRMLTAGHRPPPSVVPKRRTATSADPALLRAASPFAPLASRRKHPSMGRHDAATYVGVPVSVLIILKKNGMLCPDPAPATYGFRKVDLELFVSRLLALSCQKKVIQTGLTMTFTQIIKTQRFYSVEAKVRFIMDYLAGDIVSIGRLGHTVADILFDKDTVEAFVTGSRIRADDAYPFYTAARVLHCDNLVVGELVRQGELEPVFIRKTTRVTSTSVDMFNQRYISLASLAKELRTSSSKLVQVAKLHNFSLLTLTIPSGIASSFALRDESERLKSCALRSNTSRTLQ